MKISKSFSLNFKNPRELSEKTIVTETCDDLIDMMYAVMLQKLNIYRVRGIHHCGDFSLGAFLTEV